MAARPVVKARTEQRAIQKEANAANRVVQPTALNIPAFGAQDSRNLQYLCPNYQGKMGELQN
jgi:hypothetical protein